MFPMYIRKNLLAGIAAMAFMAANAVPPMPGYIQIAQRDGSSVTARIVGDEHFHYYETPTGECFVADAATGQLVPAAVSADGLIVAADKAAVVSDEFQQAASRTRRNVIEKRRAATSDASVAPNKIDRGFPTTGIVRGLVILAEFQDVKFQPGSTVEYFNTKINSPGYTGVETSGSVNDYFREQSGGVFTPEFDVVGPVTLPHNRATYGAAEDLDNFFRDACILADTECDVDFTRYDVNDDSFVDFLFVVFAGHGEAQGGSSDCIWPAQKDLSDYVLDRFDRKYLSDAACSCELKNGEGTDLDGVGTLCHEFSHILGLPDVYDASGMGGYGMGHYDMMCYGPYNDGGRTPAGYTAMDKYTLGWIEPMLLDTPGEYTLRPFIDSNDCYFFVNPDNRDEYYIFENRQLSGFDSALPGHGMIISYAHFVNSMWEKNTVNSAYMSVYEHNVIMPADGVRALDVNGVFSESGDPWPGSRGVTEFGSDTNPAAVWYSTNLKPADLRISNIKEDSEGVITFTFSQPSSVTSVLTPEAHAVEYFDLSGSRVDGSNLGRGLYIVRYSDGSVRKQINN